MKSEAKKIVSACLMVVSAIVFVAGLAAGNPALWGSALALFIIALTVLLAAALNEEDSRPTGLSPDSAEQPRPAAESRAAETKTVTEPQTISQPKSRETAVTAGTPGDTGIRFDRTDTSGAAQPRSRLKLCPICELNYISEEEECCTICRGDRPEPMTVGGVRKSDIGRGPLSSRLVAGRSYGTKAYSIYEECCEDFGWDWSKKGSFAPQKPLFAPRADADRTSAVWFICYSNLGGRDDPDHRNRILDNGDRIVETVTSRIGAAEDDRRITFVKVQGQYVFFGVYELVRNGLRREYKRISRTYPVEG